MKVIGVRFKSTKKIYYFNPNGFEINKGDNVIVDTSRGVEFGQTVIGIRDVPESEIVQPLQNVIRIATPEDEKTVIVNEQRQKDAYEKCLEKIQKHGLDMKLVDAEYTFDGSKLIFYFTSDGRVDFRELVKDLAILFKTRIELRQIAVRDETKMLGGLGACGNEICCKRFLGDFATVSIKMAKEQNLSLNPTKISGLCGRLICCLNFEKDFYNEMNDKLPAVSETVMSPKGQAEVVSTFPLKESVRVKYTNSDGSTDTAVFHLNEITRLNQDQRKQVKEKVDETQETASIKLEQVSEQTEQKPKDNSKHKHADAQKHKQDKHLDGNKSTEETAETSEQPVQHKNHKHKHTHNAEKAPVERNNTVIQPVATEKNHSKHHHRNHNNNNDQSLKNASETTDNGLVQPNGEKKHFEHKRNHHKHNKNNHRDSDSSANSTGAKNE